MGHKYLAGTRIVILVNCQQDMRETVCPALPWLRILPWTNDSLQKERVILSPTNLGQQIYCQFCCKNLLLKRLSMQKRSPQIFIRGSYVKHLKTPNLRSLNDNLSKEIVISTEVIWNRMMSAIHEAAVKFCGDTKYLKGEKWRWKEKVNSTVAEKSWWTWKRGIKSVSSKKNCWQSEICRFERNEAHEERISRCHWWQMC